jgi:beta-phosphoglucomutase-like phosphatase (HAD superfamily)
MPGAGPRTASSLGLPEQVRACLFDLDGVLTETAKVHAAAWKEMFDAFLKARADKGGEPFVAFDARPTMTPTSTARPGPTGRARSSSPVTSNFPTVTPATSRAHETVSGLGKAKNEIVLRMIRDDGVDAYPGSVRYLRAVVSAGLRRAVVSSSANCAAVLEAAGIAELFEVRIDGVTVEKRTTWRASPRPTPSSPRPGRWRTAPGEAAVFEDALSGVEAGRAGGFGFVVGVDRAGQAEALRAHGADIVVTDLVELLERP